MSFKVCIVGCGNIANSVHGPSYKKYAETHEGISLAACCDIDDEKSRAFQNRFAFERQYTDIKQMLSAEIPDAVCLTSPPHLTSQLAVSILEQGYPLLMEKPPGRNREETLAIINAAEKGGVPNQVAFNRRYMP
jgi:myo-inositol 2-dehydrogenase/D-chiro-inositol 1-dehydrogenase